MTLHLLMDIEALFSDPLTTGLIIALAVALVAYYFWPQSAGKAEAEVSIDAETRKKAKPLIAVAQQDADEQMFTLSHTPLKISAGEKLMASVNAGEFQDEPQIREILWAQQRAMITRLESELDYAQQADISDHFAIAAPANQPGALLAKTLLELEGMLHQIRKFLKLKDDQRLWHGRAMILMLSTRKLFDHVAWLTNAGLAHSAPGSFMLAGDDVVTIAIYATRVELGLLDQEEQQGGPVASFANETQVAKDKSILEAAFSRPLLLQVGRAAVRCLGGERTPQWLEYGLAHRITDQLIGKVQLRKDEKPPVWVDEAVAIFDPAAWDKAADDSSRLEQLVTWSAVHVGSLKPHALEKLTGELARLRRVDSAESSSLLATMAQHQEA